MPQCEFRKQDGQRCGAKAMHGATLCLSHNPAAADIKRAATRKGGRNRRLRRQPACTPGTGPTRSIGDVRRLLFQTLDQIRGGTVDADTARALGYVSGIAAKIHESAELEERVSKLEALMASLEGQSAAGGC